MCLWHLQFSISSNIAQLFSCSYLITIRPTSLANIYVANFPFFGRFDEKSVYDLNVWLRRRILLVGNRVFDCAKCVPINYMTSI